MAIPLVVLGAVIVAGAFFGGRAAMRESREQLLGEVGAYLILPLVVLGLLGLGALVLALFGDGSGVMVWIGLPLAIGFIALVAWRIRH